MIILGIDPGTAIIGYGVVTKKKNLEMINYGCIRTEPKFSDPERLRILSNELNKVIKKYKPDILAIENIFFFNNARTAMKVSQAKGVILLAAAKKKIPVCEFAPLQIKAIITGNGRAKKKEVQEKIKELFCLKEIPKPDDAADALAIASSFFLCDKKKIKLS